MKFLHLKFQAKKKEIVEVELDKPARVKFMTASEFKRYTGARTHTFFGGQFGKGRVHFVLPFDSVWSVVVEKGTHGDPVDVRASVKLLPADRNKLSTVALDAPAHVRNHALLEESEAVSEEGSNEG
jgi:Domain of unknown function (DUF1883)